METNSPALIARLISTYQDWSNSFNRYRPRLTGNVMKKVHVAKNALTLNEQRGGINRGYNSVLICLTCSYGTDMVLKLFPSDRKCTILKKTRITDFWSARTGRLLWFDPPVVRRNERSNWEFGVLRGGKSTWTSNWAVLRTRQRQCVNPNIPRCNRWTWDAIRAWSAN